MDIDEDLDELMEYEETLLSQSKSSKRKIAHQEEAEPAKLSKSEVKRRKKCHFKNALHLGFCKLDEINYYECLKLEFGDTFSKDFIIKVNEATNNIILEVRNKNLKEVLHNNKVSNIVKLIESSRSTLTDNNTKQKYDTIIKAKLKTSDILNEMDKKILQVNKMADAFHSSITDLKELIAKFNSPSPSMYYYSENLIDGSNIILKGNIFVRNKILLTEEIKRNSIITQRTKRLSTMNRVQIDFKLSDDEKPMSREYIENKVIKPAFEKFGAIKSILICPLKKDRAIVEYVTSDSVQRAIDITKQDLQNRFTVKEFLTSDYFSPTLITTMEIKVNKLANELKQLQNSLNVY
jgi:RNA recognition motif. (a.k.a. RRM, RBD, or RNP domain)